MNKIIVRIAEGLGNQLFMYANAFALSKKINYNFFVTLQNFPCTIQFEKES